MQRKAQLDTCFDRLEVQPPLAIHTDEVRRCKLTEVRKTQTYITAKQEGIQHVTQFFIANLEVLQFPQFVRRQELVPALFLLDFEFSEWISVCVNVSLIDCLINQSSELP